MGRMARLSPWPGSKSRGGTIFIEEEGARLRVDLKKKGVVSGDGIRSMWQRFSYGGERTRMREENRKQQERGKDFSITTARKEIARHPHRVQ